MFNVASIIILLVRYSTYVHTCICMNTMSVQSLQCTYCMFMCTCIWPSYVCTVGTLFQCLSLIPGLQKVCRSGRLSLNLSSLDLTISADRLGLGRSLNVLVSLCIVLHMLPISSSTSSALRSINGPGGHEQMRQHS